MFSISARKPRPEIFRTRMRYFKDSISKYDKCVFQRCVATGNGARDKRRNPVARTLYNRERVE